MQTYEACIVVHAFCVRCSSLWGFGTRTLARSNQMDTRAWDPKASQKGAGKTNERTQAPTVPQLGLREKCVYKGTAQELTT